METMLLGQGQAHFTMRRIWIALLVLVCGCNDEGGIAPPIVTTADPSDVTLTSATSGGSILHERPDLITTRGVCWGRNSSPVLNILSSKTEDGTGAGTFVSHLTGLGLFKYYLRAYATVGGQTYYGNEVILDIASLAPSLTMTHKQNIDNSSLEVETSIAYAGIEPIVERGVLWSVSNNPTLNTANKLIDGGTTLIYSTVIGPLSQWTLYYVRGYAVTSEGVYYSNVLQLILLPPVSYGSVTDVDGNTYRTTIIGSKTWLADNLMVTHYNDGSPITNASSQASFMDIGSGAFIAYDNSVSNVSVYGYLYNGYVVNNGKNVCMTGWHLPSAAEWQEMANSLGGQETAGGRMKAMTQWSSPNIAADNSSGFNGIPGGSYCRVCLGNTGIFADLGTDGYWRSSSPETFFYATNDLSSLRTKGTAHLNDGLSIRCVKD